MNKITIGVILAGCGVYDGSEIHETTLTLLALDQLNVTVKPLSISKQQRHTVDHTSQTEQASSDRNCLIESGRIARGCVDDIASININDFDAFIFPGGFGVAKNLSSFATEGANCWVDPTIEHLIKQAHQLKKPLGFMCIAPVLAAKVIPNVKLTIGSDSSTAQALEAMGATHINATINDIIFDETNLVVSTPAYMLANRLSQLPTGINALVNKLYTLAKQYQQTAQLT